MAARQEFKLLVRAAKQIVQVVNNGERVVTGENMKRVAILEGTEDEGYSIVVSRDGNIYDIGPDLQITEKYKNATFDHQIDASGKCILPGLVDAHTHPVWAGDRVNEFAMKLAGATYMEVHKAGGGIYYTVDHTRSTSEEKLFALLRSRLVEMLRCGTTLVEAKSGYGLEPETELKMLRVIQRAKNELPIDISSTFCGAHAVPRGKYTPNNPIEVTTSLSLPTSLVNFFLKKKQEFDFETTKSEENIPFFRDLVFKCNTRYFGGKFVNLKESADVNINQLIMNMSYRNMTSDEATQSILTRHLPQLQRAIASGEIEVDNIDVFCEEGVFSVQQSRQILEAGRQLGFNINFHGDELHPVGAAEMGAELRAEAISHLEEISNAGITAMAKARSIAVILPTTAYMLKLSPPPVRNMIEKGVPVALGSDFNPNAFCLSMPLVMHLACVLCKMNMAEALNAATINAAAALGKASSHGSLEVGKAADIIIINAKRWEHLIYQMGNHSSLINSVIKKGTIIHQNEECSLI